MRRQFTIAAVGRYALAYGLDDMATSLYTAERLAYGHVTFFCEMPN